MKAGLRIFDGLFTFASFEFKDNCDQFYKIFTKALNSKSNYLRL